MKDNEEYSLLAIILSDDTSLQVVINAKDGGGRSSQAIAIVLATDPSLTSFSSLAPLPGMETYQTFLPNPSAVTPKMTLSTSNGIFILQIQKTFSMEKEHFRSK